MTENKKMPSLDSAQLLSDAMMEQIENGEMSCTSCKKSCSSGCSKSCKNDGRGDSSAEGTITIQTLQ